MNKMFPTGGPKKPIGHDTQENLDARSTGTHAVQGLPAGKERHSDRPRRRDTVEERPTAEQIGIKGGQGQSAEDVRSASHTSTWVVVGVVIAIIAVAVSVFFF